MNYYLVEAQFGHVGRNKYIVKTIAVIAENGKILAKNTKIADSDYILTTDIDLGKIKADRSKFRSFNNLSLVTETLSYVRLKSEN